MLASWIQWGLEGAPLPAGKCVPEGKKLRKQQPTPPPFRRHLVAGLGCTPQGSGAGKVFLCPLCSEIISWESTGVDVLLEALRVPLVSPVVRGPCSGGSEVCGSTRTFAWGVLFPVGISLLLLKCFAWSEPSVTSFLL